MVFVRSQGFRPIWVKLIVFVVMVGIPVTAFFFMNEYRGKTEVKIPKVPDLFILMVQGSGSGENGQGVGRRFTSYRILLKLNQKKHRGFRN